MSSRLIFTIGLLATAVLARSQESVRNEGDALLARFSYGLQLPGGDLSQRFGRHFSLGLGVDFLTADSNWSLGLEGQFLFGNEVRQDVLAPLRTPEGLIYGNDQRVADIQLRQRGFYLGLIAGKLISLSEANPRSGLRLALGGGLLQHQIRIQDDPGRSAPQLSDEKKKGYDRLSNGPALHQYLGYQLLRKDGRVNFSFGLECFQAFTRNRRDLNFDTRRREDALRLDLVFGLRATWILPFYLGAGENIYY